MAHTSGPWLSEFSEDGGYDCMTDCFRIVSFTDARQHFIADVDLGSYGQSTRTREIEDERKAEAEANARLMAAAPDLLQSLREMRELEEMHREGGSGFAMSEFGDKVRARCLVAISKAEGR